MQFNPANLAGRQAGRRAQQWEGICLSSPVHSHHIHHRHCNVFLYCLLTLSVWLCEACFTSMSCFSLPPLLLPLLFVLDEKASPGAPEDDGKLSVGPV